MKREAQTRDVEPIELHCGCSMMRFVSRFSAANHVETAENELIIRETYIRQALSSKAVAENMKNRSSSMSSALHEYVNVKSTCVWCLLE